MENQQIELCALIAQLLRSCDDPRVDSVSMDCGSDDGELIVKFAGVEFVVKPVEL